MKKVIKESKALQEINKIDLLRRKKKYQSYLESDVKEAVSPKGWNMSKKYITIIAREVKNLAKYHRVQNEEDFLEVANYIELQIKQMKKDLNEAVNEAFRPSDKKALMVIGRDTINKLRKTSPDIDKPSKQLGQAINAIFRAMTREKSDANYKQYKKYNNLKDKMVTSYEEQRLKKLNNFFITINPIIQKYMNDNSINMLLEQKNVFIGKTSSDITDKIIVEINKSSK